jgi:thiamine transport system permease protein
VRAIPRWLKFLAWAWVVTFLVGAIGSPIVALLRRAAQSPEAASVSLLDPSLVGVAVFTARQALVSTLLALGIGAPIGLWIGSRARGRVLAWSRALLAVPFAMPTVVLSMALVLWLGRGGFLAQEGVRLDWLYTVRAVILAHALLNAPWVALIVADARAQVPDAQIGAAAALGAGPPARFAHVIWPRIRWAWAAAGAQVFALCTLSFAIVLLLGGGPPVETLETAIFSRIRGATFDLPGALVCGVWQLAVALIPWIAVLVFQRREKRLYLNESFSGGWKVLRSPSRFNAGTALLASGFFILPYLIFVTPEHWRLWADREFLHAVAQPLRISVELALAAAVLTVLTVVMALIASGRSRRTVFPVLLSLPSGISVLVLGLGFWLAYGGVVDPFDGSLPAMVALQSVLFLPFAYRLLWPLLGSFQPREFDAARMLGASPLRAFFVTEWPRWKGPVFSALAMTAGASLGEVAAVSLFYSEKLIPLPLLLTRWMGQYRFEQAQALAALLLVLSAGLTLVLGSQGQPVQE